MKPELRIFLAWVFASTLGLVIALAPLASAFADGHYVPFGPDSFYHARRILDAVASPGSFYQFDPQMHVPEGGLIIWPWAYDYFMALLVRLGLALHLSRDPMAILVHIPVVAYPLCLALVWAICRQLRLGVAATCLAMFAMAAFPLNQGLYGVGNIDHHFGEHLFVLGSLAAGLAWLRKPESNTRAIITGIALGLAPGVHTALFILQLPLLAALGISWLRGTPRPRTSIAFAIALLVASLAVALPSLSLQQGNFQFQTLSWFQVYVAACTGVLAVLLSRWNAERSKLIGIGAIAFVMLLPVIGQMTLASDFFTVSVEAMGEISEVQSPAKLALRPGGIFYVGGLYSLLFVLVPVSALLCVWKVWTDLAAERRYFWLASLFGLTLLVLQLRLEYFGSFALFLPLLYVVDEWARTRAKAPALVWVGAAVVLAIAFSPGFRTRLFEKSAVAGDPYYDINRDMFPVLAKACEQAPGVVLANPNDGHYLRYHTQCPVIANNFLLTKQQEQKVREERALLSLPSGEVAARAPAVKYLYIRRDSLFGANEEGSLVLMPQGDPRNPDFPLVQELLTTPADKLPVGYTLLGEAGPARTPYARVFALNPSTP